MRHDYQTVTDFLKMCRASEHGLSQVFVTEQDLKRQNVEVHFAPFHFKAFCILSREDKLLHDMAWHSHCLSSSETRSHRVACYVQRSHMQIWWVEAWERAPKNQAMGIYNHVTMYNRCSRCNLESSPLDSQF